MAKDTFIRTEIIITANAKQADATMKEVAASAEKIKAEIKELEKTGQGDSDRAKWLTQLYQSLNSISRESVNGIERVKKAVANLSGQSVSQLRRARRVAQQFRDSLSEKDAGFPEAEENLRKINNQIELMTGKQRRLSEATKNFNGTLGKISTASIDKLNEALKDGEVMLNRMSKSEVEQAGVVPGMAKIRQEIANRRMSSMEQMRASVSSVTSTQTALQNAAPAELTEQISVAKNALDKLPGSLEKTRKFFTDAIGVMQAQLQKLNGTFVNTDDFINKTFADMQKKAASPKQLAEAIGYIRQKLDELPLSEEKQRAQYTKMMESMIAQTKQAKGELQTVKQLKESVGNLSNNPSALESASPAKITEQIANARRALDMLPASSGKMRQFFVDAIRTMQTQLQKLNGTLVNTNDVINKTFADMKKDAASPKQLAEAIGFIKQKLDELPASEQAQRKQYKQMMDDMIQQTKRLSGELMSLQQMKESVGKIAFPNTGLNTATPAQLNENIAIAKKALDNLPATEDTLRKFFSGAIGNMEEQLRVLNGTLENTDNVINKTMTDIQSKSVTPKQLSQSIALLKQKLDSLPASAEQDRKKLNQMLATMIQENKRLRGELTLTDEELKKIREDINSGKIKTVSFDKLREAAKQMRLELSKISESDDKYKQLQKDIEKVEAQLNKSTAAVNKHGSAWKTTIKNMMAYVGVFGMLNMVKSKIEEIISMNNKLSDQMANIRKVSNLPMEDIKGLTKTIYKQDTRTAPTEMLDIAYAGAKLGMGNGGADQLAAFTRAANTVNVALKEDMGPEALTALSKIVENMGLIKSMGVEEAMNKVGSAMFRLSSTSTATSSNIVEFARRLTAMARVAGITTDQLLALGSASDSMYLAPEVAATAFTKLFSSLQTNHNLIEKTLTIPPGTINSYFKQGEAMKAVLLIFQRMHDMGNMNALKPIFKDLGSDGARLMNVMTAMAKNVDMLKEHLNTSNEAYKEGTAVLDEYNIQQQTSQALMERANNLWQKTFINEENVDVVHDLAQGWYDLTKSFTSSQVVVATLKWALQGLITLLKGIMYLLPSIIMGFGAQGLVLSFTKLFSIIVGLRTFVLRLAVAFRALSVAAKANWIIAVGSAIAFVASKALEACTSTEKATGFMQGFERSLRGAGGAIADSVAELEGYKRAIENAAVGTERRNLAIANFNKKFGTYLSKLLTEKSTAKDLALAYEEVNSALQKKAYLELRDKDMKQQIVPRAAHERNLGMDYDNAISNTSSAGFNSAYLRKFWQENRGKTFDQMAYLLNQSMFNTPLNDATYNRVRYLDSHSSTDVVPDEINKKIKNVYTDKNGVKHTGNKSVANAQTRFFLALRYLRTYGGMQNAIINVDNKYKDLNLDEFQQKEELGDLKNDAEDKDAKAKARAAAAAARKERAKKIRDANERFKNAKEEATAVVSAIDEYYTLQKEAIEQMYNDGKVTRVKADNLKLWLENRRLQVQVEAHKALGGRDNQFEEMKKELGWGYDRVDQSTNSDASEKIIKNFNGPATYKLLSSFSGGDGMPDGRSVINDINKKGAEMKLKLTEANGKVIKAVDDYFNQFNVVKDVSDNLAQQLTDMGVVFEKPKNFFKGQEADHKDRQELDPSAIELQDVTVSAAAPDSTQMKLLQSFILNGNKNYGFDAKDNNQLGNWLKEFVTNGDWNAKEDTGTTPNKTQFQDWAKAMPDMENWVKDIPKYQQQIQSFYVSLLTAEGNYYNKMKSNTDREKRILDERFERSDSGKRYEQEERDLQVANGIQNIYGRGETSAFLNTQEMARNNGFADNIANDPEVMLAEEQMRKMREKLELARQTEKDQQALQAAERAAQDAELAYADKINSQIKARIDLLQQWVDPLQEFSEAMGDAFVKMTESAEEGRDAMKQATENMVKTFAKMTINMIAQQLKMEVQRALFHKRMQRSEADYMEGMKGENEKGHKSIFKALGSFFKKKQKSTKKDQSDEKKQKNKAEKEQTQTVKESGEAQQKVKTEVANKTLEINKKADTQSSQSKVETAAADANTTATETQGNIFAGIASGAAKIIGKLGWWGIPLIAVIQGLLMGLLNSALGKLFGGKNKSASNTNTKLVSGMLTYDSGNVEAFSGAIDKKTYPVVGNDGKVYAAKPTDKLVTGLLTEPVATTVNGVPSLVAERGPEMIIGRETTQALMMARPDIISEIVKFDRNHSGKTYKAYDQGNVSEVMSNLSTPLISSPQQQATQADMANLLTTMQAMMPAMQAFVRQLQQPLKTSINMYGNGGLYDSMSRASKFMKGRG